MRPAAKSAKIALRFAVLAGSCLLLTILGPAQQFSGVIEGTTFGPNSQPVSGTLPMRGCRMDTPISLNEVQLETGEDHPLRRTIRIDRATNEVRVAVVRRNPEYPVQIPVPADDPFTREVG